MLKEKWHHTRKLRVKDRGPHEPRPYSRIGDDNRCETCGDIIEKEASEKFEKYSPQKI